MAPRYEGTTIRLGEGSYVLPALSFRDVQRGYAEGWLTKVFNLKPDSQPPTSEEMDAMFEAAASSLRRNYPEITRDQALDLFDMRNIQPLIGAVLGLTLPERLREDGAAKGEATSP